MSEKKPFPIYYRVACHTDHIGPGSTFVAVKGMKLDGTSFIHEALKRGATKIVIEEGMVLDPQLKQEIAARQAELQIVPSTRLALAELSAESYAHPANSLKIIAITGTKGKTTTAFLVEHILKTAGFKTAIVSTVGNRILDESYATDLTTPHPDYLHVFFDRCRSMGVEFVVMEAAAQALSLHRLATLTFDAIAFTNFSQEHAEFYTDQEEYFNAKLQVFKQLAPQGRAVLNADDARVAACAGMVSNPVFVHVEVNNESIKDMSVSRTLPSLDTIDSAYGPHQSLGMNGNNKNRIIGCVLQSDLSALKLEIQSGNQQYACSSRSLLGQFSAYNVLTAIALVEPYGVSTTATQNALATFDGVPGRLKRYDLPNKAVAFIDNAHTPSSFDAILSALRPLSFDLIVVFGAGGDRDALKRPLMGHIAAQYADTIFLTTDNPRSEDPAVIIDQIKTGIADAEIHKVQIILDREEAIKKAYAISQPGTIIALLGKGPVEYQHVKDIKIPFSEATILRSL